MAVTAAGTAWHTVTTTLPNGDTALVGAADSIFTAGTAPCIIYAHGNMGAYNQFTTLAAWTALREWLIDNGCFWIESAGAGNQWGSPTGIAAYEDAYEWGITEITPTATVALLRSMGGSYARSFAGSATIDPEGIIINSGTLDLAARGTSGSDVTAIRAAYGTTTLGQFLTAVAPYDPMQAATSAWAGVHVLNMWGDADTTVPPNINGQAFATDYAAFCASYSQYVRPGGDHSGGNGSYLDVAPMTAFLTDVFGIEPPEPVIPAGRTVVDAYHLLNGRRHRIISM